MANELVVHTGIKLNGSIPSGSGEPLLARNATTGLFQTQSSASGNPFSDSETLIKNFSDPTKLAKFSASGITTGTTRTYTLPNNDGTVALLTDVWKVGGTTTLSSAVTINTTSDFSFNATGSDSDINFITNNPNGDINILAQGSSSWIVLNTSSRLNLISGGSIHLQDSTGTFLDTAPLNDNTLTQILGRNSSGQIKYRDVSTIITSPGWQTSGDTILSSSGTVRVYEATNTGSLRIQIGDNNISAYTALTLDPGNAVLTVVNASLQDTSFVINAGGGAVFYDFINGYGIQYAYDYSAGYTLRSLVDKEYVDANSGITNTAAANELMKSNGTNAIPSGLFSTADGNLILGSSSLSGTGRAISVDNPTANASLQINAQGNLILNAPSGTLIQADTTGSLSSVANILVIRRTSTGTAANGFGVGIAFQLENGSGAVASSSPTIEAVFTDVTSGSEDIDLVFRTVASGAAAAEKVRITSDGRIYGTAIHNNAGPVTGTTNQYIASGTYTPTITNGINVASSTAHACQWLRVGNVVTVSGAVDIDPTLAASTDTSWKMSLPITTTFVSLFNLAGTYRMVGTPSDGGAIQAEIGGTANLAVFEHLSTTLSASAFYFHFTYLIL